MEQPERSPVVHPDQLVFEVPTSPNAIGKWTPEEQFKAYAAMFGEDAAERQRKLAEEANECSCGAEKKEAFEAKRDDRKVRHLNGHQHGAGCPKRRSAPELRGLSPAAQRELYEASRRAAA